MMSTDEEALLALLRMTGTALAKSKRDYDCPVRSLEAFRADIVLKVDHAVCEWEQWYERVTEVSQYRLVACATS
jgi:hypothetical protein